jgi:hypothetical protein
MAKKDKEITLISPEEQRLLADKIQKRVDSATSYKTTRGLYDEWAEYQRFWDADQWPAATADTENFPRPLTNHFGEIIEMKTAGLVYELSDIYCEPRKGSLQNTFEIPVQPLTQGAEPFTIKPEELLLAVFDNIKDQNNFDQLVENVCRSGALLGDGISFSDWNNEIVGGGDAGFVGEVEVQEIDITDFFVGDPLEADIQKQPYVGITAKIPLTMAKHIYSQYSDNADLLQPETSSTQARYDHEKTEQSETDYVNLIHYWERAIEEEESEIAGVAVTKKFAGINYYVICQDMMLREEKDHYYSKKYPFAHFGWYPKRKSFYSKPESKDLINNQKELNRLQGIALLGAYKTGLPNIVYKPGFVKKEEVSVGPGGNVIADDTPPGQGKGVDYLQPPTIASYIPLLKDSMAQGMKDVSGVHEAWSGKAPSAHLNASAIMALQEAAGVRIRGIQRRLHKMISDMATIWLGFIMQYYTEDRVFKVYGKNNVEGLAVFRVEDFKKMEFDIKVTMSSASPYSKTVIASTLEGMIDKGIIDGDLYLKMLPPEVFPKVADLLELVKDREAEQEQKVLAQQLQIIDEVVVQTIEQARAAGVPIAPEVLQEMLGMIQQSSQKQEV